MAENVETNFIFYRISAQKIHVVRVLHEPINAAKHL